MTAPLALTKPKPFRLTTKEFLALDRSGAFRDYAKTELIDGTVYVVNAQYSEHMKAKIRLLFLFKDTCDRLDRGLEAWSGGAVEFAPASMPEPDVLITTRTPQKGPIPPDTVALIVEVAETTLSFDLGKKARAYAKGGLREYWVLDLPGRTMHRHWSPTPKGYEQHDKLKLGQRIEAITIPGLEIETAGID